MHTTTTNRRAIVISSKGEMDVAAITLMGLSTKRDDDSKIGMFGTGLKYSLAKLLRDRIEFRIYNGVSELSVTTRSGSMRGQAYEQILVDGETTSITTDMGPQWETWWIVRELLSNARDEEESSFTVEEWDAVRFRPGYTTIVLDYLPFESVWLNREKYFVTERLPKWENSRLRVYARAHDSGTRLYKNGVLIFEDQLAADAFDYDLLHAELNEMREPRYPSLLAQEATELFLTEVEDLRLITDYVTVMNNHLRYFKTVFTGSVSSWRLSTLKLSAAWKHYIEETSVRIATKDAIGPDLASDAIVLPGDIVGIATGHQDSLRPLEIYDPNPTQRKMLDSVLQKLYDANFEVKFPIRIANLSTSVIAQASSGTILLSDRAFATELLLVECLLEETIHLVSGAGDATRAFQNAIFTTWASGILNLNSSIPETR